MIRSGTIRLLLCLSLLFVVFGGLMGEGVLAQEPQGALTLTTDFPILRGESGDSFQFSASLTWLGTVAKNFNLSMTTPPQWTATIRRSYPATEIAAIRMEANRDFAEKFDITFSPVAWNRPEPGEYVATLNVVSDDGAIKQSIDLKTEVTAIYSFRLATSSGNLNFQVTAGEGNAVSIVLANNGTATLRDITFSSSPPAGWLVTFNPSRVDSLEAGGISEVELNIKPPSGETIAGDYMVSIEASNTDYQPEPLRFRVTVLTPSFWGWVSILIVILVVAGLAMLFWRLGRR